MTGIVQENIRRLDFGTGAIIDSIIDGKNVPPEDDVVRARWQYDEFNGVQIVLDDAMSSTGGYGLLGCELAVHNKSPEKGVMTF